MPVSYDCPDCGTANEIAGGETASSVVEIACWSCDTIFEVDRYRKEIMGVLQ